MVSLGASSDLPPMPDEGGIKNFMKSRRRNSLDHRHQNFDRMLQYMTTNTQMQQDPVVMEFLGLRLESQPDTVARFTQKKEDFNWFGF